MKFLYPQFLYAFALLAIPIIIHLFNFKKYKTTYFSNVRFLKNIKEKTKSQSQLKHFLILTSRLGIFSFIILAFAQPYITSKNNIEAVEKNAVSIFIDNSFSMEGLTKNGSSLNIAKAKALEIVKAYKETDEFQFLDQNFNGINQRIISKKEINESILNTEISSYNNSLNEIINRQTIALSPSLAKQKNLYIISDFLGISSSLSKLNLDSNININFIPIETIKNDNIFIDSCWFESPNVQIGKEQVLKVKIKNTSSEIKKDLTLKFFINQQQVALNNFNIVDQEIVTLKFISNQKGWNKGVVKIQDSPITFDNNYYISFEVKKTIKILSIFNQESHPSLSKIFKNDNYFDFVKSKVKQLTFNQFNKYDLIILDQLPTLSSGLINSLENFIANGGDVLIFPSDEMNIDNFNQLNNKLNISNYLSKSNGIEITELNYNHNIYDGVFKSNSEKINFPKIDLYFEINNSKNNTSSIVNYINKSSFLNEYNYKNGKIYLSSVGLSEKFGNFTKHAIFVPLIYNIASNCIGNQIISYEVGAERIFTNKTFSNNQVKIKNELIEFIPNVRQKSLWLNNQITKDGHYDVVSKDSIWQNVSFNYNREQSNLNAFDLSTLTLNKKITIIDEELNKLSEIIIHKNEGKSMWIVCIILSLIFITIETLLLKLL